MSRYASAGGGPVNAAQEFKQMVKALHSAGIEVVTFVKVMWFQIKREEKENKDFEL